MTLLSCLTPTSPRFRQLPVKGLEVGVGGEKDVAIAGTTLKQAKLSNEAPKGETAKVTLAVTKAAKLEFVTTGKGQPSFQQQKANF